MLDINGSVEKTEKLFSMIGVCYDYTSLLEQLMCAGQVRVFNMHIQCTLL